MNRIYQGRVTTIEMLKSARMRTLQMSAPRPIPGASRCYIPINHRLCRAPPRCCNYSKKVRRPVFNFALPICRFFAYVRARSKRNAKRISSWNESSL